MKRILIVEDDRRIAELVSAAAVREGWETEVALDGETGLQKLKSSTPDLIVLDRALPGVDGLTILREVRKVGHVPVLILTAKDQEDDKVAAFELGADDYVTKPFSVRELVMRIKSLFRRSPVQEAPASLVFDELEVRLSERILFVSGAPVETTRTEFDLLVTLASSPGTVFSRERLLQDVWGYRFEGYERSVDSQVTRLRKKIETNPKEPRFIETVWGVGYRFRSADSPAET